MAIESIIFLGFAVVMVVIFLIATSFGKRYKKAESLLTKAELNFYNQIRGIEGNDEILLMKVRMADIVQPTGSNRKKLYQVTSKHADFVLANKITLEPTAVIELDDASHNRKDRVERDRLVDKIYKESGIPIIHVKIGKSYDAQKIKTEIQKRKLEVLKKG